VQALSEVVPSIAEAKIGAGGFMVLRPDSGDPVEAVIAALEAAEKVFGVDVNSKGYKVPRGCGVIQGDGVSLQAIAAILAAVLSKGYSADVSAAGFHSCLISSLCATMSMVASPKSVLQMPRKSLVLVIARSWLLVDTEKCRTSARRRPWHLAWAEAFCRE
jgi:nicotinamide phosphoribosyltransferase